MDLQDLGYETCGRSENEAEREDASSPGDEHTELLSNFFSLEKKTSLILHQCVSFIRLSFRV